MNGGNGNEHAHVHEMESTSTSPTSETWNHPKSLWGRVQMLPYQIQRQLLDQYRGPFSVEVRDVLATLIEEQSWSEIDEDNPNEINMNYANQALELILEGINNTVHTTTDFVRKTKLRKSEHELRQRYTGKALEFVRLVKNYLAHERRMVSQAENATSETGETQFQRHMNLSQKIENLQTRTQESENILQPLDEKLKLFNIARQEYSQYNARIQQCDEQAKHMNNSMGLAPYDYALVNKRSNLSHIAEGVKVRASNLATQLLQLRQIFIKHFHQTYMELEELRQMLEQEVTSWKQQQTLASNGAEFDTQSLATIQSWYECLADLTLKNRNQALVMVSFGRDISTNNPPGIEETAIRLSDHINSLLTNLVRSAFVVECQPPQILKVNNKFNAKVRLLLGNKLITYVDPPEVIAVIISERQLSGLEESKTPELFKENYGKLINGGGRMDYNETTKEHSVIMKSMQLQQKIRTDRKQNVADEKVCIVFKSKFQIGNEKQFCWTRSNPIVVIVHGSQECRAMGTVMWDNQFALPDRSLFAVPDSVLWPQMADLLSCKFKATTGRGLEKEHLNYLAHKIFGERESDDYSQDCITFDQFVKKSLNLPSGPIGFSFWDWFHSIMKLVTKHLRELWQHNCIVGFISRPRAEEQLRNVRSGNFMLRFSESELGGVTVGWVEVVAKETDYHIGEEIKVNFAQPYEAEDFTVKSLPERIKDVDKLEYLYPNISKEEAFQNYWLPYPVRNSKKKVNPNYGHMPTLTQNMVEVPPTDRKSTRKREVCRNPDGDYDDAMDFGNQSEFVYKREVPDDVNNMTTIGNITGFGTVNDESLNVVQIFNNMDIVASPGSLSLDAFNELLAEDPEGM